MKKSSYARIIVLVLSLALLIGSVMVITAMADESAEVGTFGSISVGYGDKVYIRVVVNATEDQIKNGDVVVSYTLKGETANAEYFDTDAQGRVWVITEGIAAYDMAQEVVFSSTVNGEKVEENRTYSVAQFIYTMLYTNNGTTPEFKDMYEALLAYGEKAQIALNKNADKLITASTIVTGAANVTFNGKDIAFAPAASIEVTPTWNGELGADQTLAGWKIKENGVEKTVGLTFTASGVVEIVEPVFDAHIDTINYTWADDYSYCKATLECSNGTHTTEETVYLTKLALNVTATNATYTYVAQFENEAFAEQVKTVNADCAVADGIATVNAPAMEGKVASHDYVKFDVKDAAANYDFVIYYSEVDVWDGTSVSEGLAGAGTAEDPFLIQSAADLAYVAKVTNEANAAGAHSFIGQYLKLTKSIDLNNHELHIGTGSGWGKGFNGHLEGNNCTIRNMNNKYPLFGGMYTSWVKNLSLYGKVQSDRNYIAALGSYTFNTTFHNVTNYANITGTNGVGGLVAIMEQNGRTSEGMVNYGNIVATGWLNGGIVGKFGGNLTNSINWGSVTANGDSNVGGVAGGSQNAASWYGTISNCANYGVLNNNGKAAGHIIGGSYTGTAVVDCIHNHVFTKVNATPVSCEADGNVEYWACSVCKKNFDANGNVIANVVIKATGHVWDEGVVADGKITFTCQNDNSHTRVEDAAYTVTVNHLFLDGTVAAEAEALQFGYNQIATINAKAIEGYVASHDYVKVHVFENETINIYYSEVSVWDGTSVSESLTGTGTAEDPFLIQSAADFAYFANTLNNATVGTTENYKGQYIKMTVSVDLNNNLLIAGNHSAWNKYQGFGGTFDGNNCTIRNINVSPTTGTSAALFGCITKAGTLMNLSVYGNVSGAASVGGVVAYQLGTVTNVTSYVTVTATGGTVGGVVANQESSATGPLSGCVNYGSVTSNSYIVGGIAGSGGKDIINCVNWGDVSGSTQIAGISGTTKNAGKISGCYNYGNVKGSVSGGIAGLIMKPVENCVNYGDINGTFNNGGIAGQIAEPKNGTVYSATFTNCVNYGNVNGSTTHNGGILGSAPDGSGCTIIGCTNYGKVTASWGGGGIAGYGVGEITNCVNYGEIAGQGQLGGIVGKFKGTAITGCTNNGVINATANVAGGIVGTLYTTDIKDSVEANNTNKGTITCPGNDKSDIIGKVGT